MRGVLGLALFNHARLAFLNFDRLELDFYAKINAEEHVEFSTRASRLYNTKLLNTYYTYNKLTEIYLELGRCDEKVVAEHVHWTSQQLEVAAVGGVRLEVGL